VSSVHAPTRVGKGFTYVEERRGSGGRRGNVYLNTNGTSFERVLVLRIPELPFVPDLVDHLDNVHVSATPPDETVDGIVPRDEGKTWDLFEGRRWVSGQHARI